MALRTATQVADLVRAITLIGYQKISLLNTYGLQAINALRAQIRTGDQVPENEAMEQQLRNYEAAEAAAFGAWTSLVTASHPALARLAGAPSLADPILSYDHFQKYLVANSIEFKQRGFTKATGSTVVGNGAGVIAIGSTDINGDVIDVGHVGDLVLVCDQDVSQGATAGRERFKVTGNPAGREHAWDEGGPFIANTYDYNYGTKDVAADIGPAQARARSGGNMSAQGSGNGNLVPNGNFQSAITGAANDVNKLPRWYFADAASASAVEQETTDPIEGARSLIADDDFIVSTDIVPNQMRSKNFYGLGIKLETKNAGGTVTGDLIVRVMNRDNSATHATLTIDLSTLTLNTKYTIALATNFFIPASAKDLKVQLELDTLGASAGTPTVKIGAVISSMATLVDGYTLWVLDGSSLDSSGNIVGRFKYGDTFTITTSSTDAGIIQTFYANRALGRYFRSAASPTANWEDPAALPVFAVAQSGTSIVQGGTDAQGNQAVDTYELIYTITNTGFAPLWIGDATIDNESNVGPISNQALNTMLAPGESLEFKVDYTISGAGAFSFDISVYRSDAPTGPFDWTVTGTGT